MVTREFIDNHDIDYAGQPGLRALHEEGFPPLARSTIIFTYIDFHTKLDYNVLLSIAWLHNCTHGVDGMIILRYYLEVSIT